ncbi:MAG: hypothetical protein IANPNBLG_03578 [Bryobacteraceae bacterium]|nr:hypothetical protein [Bryobacteraceae bacterium]
MFSEAEVVSLLRLELCTLCDERRPDGSCGLKDPACCQLNQRLPLVAAILTNEKRGSPSHFPAIREALCSTCPRPVIEGSCAIREHVSSEVVIATLLQPFSTRYVPLAPAPASPSMVVDALERAIDAVSRRIGAAAGE